MWHGSDSRHLLLLVGILEILNTLLIRMSLYIYKIVYTLCLCIDFDISHLILVIFLSKVAFYVFVIWFCLIEGMQYLLHLCINPYKNIAYLRGGMIDCNCRT